MCHICWVTVVLWSNRFRTHRSVACRTIDKLVWLKSRGYRTQHDFSLAWLEAAWYSSGSVLHIILPYIVLNSRVLLIYTDTVKELPGYPVKNTPSVSFLSWGGLLAGGGIVYDIVWMGWCPRKPWIMLRTLVVAFYPIVVSHLSFNFLCLLL